jgi:hypothetical protein
MIRKSGNRFFEKIMRKITKRDHDALQPEHITIAKGKAGRRLKARRGILDPTGRSNPK